MDIRGTCMGCGLSLFDGVLSILTAWRAFVQWILCRLCVAWLAEPGDEICFSDTLEEWEYVQVPAIESKADL